MYPFHLAKVDILTSGGLVSDFLREISIVNCDGQLPLLAAAFSKLDEFFLLDV